MHLYNRIGVGFLLCSSIERYITILELDLLFLFLYKYAAVRDGIHFRYIRLSFFKDAEPLLVSHTLHFS